MGDQYITIGELGSLVSIFVGPVLLGAGFTQFVLLRQTGLRIGTVLGMLLAAVVVTLLLTWGLLYVVPPTLEGSGGGVLLLPALFAAVAVTVCVGLFARPRRRR
jgi:hypothetical protein